MFFSFAYLALRARLGLLVRSGRGPDIKNIELMVLRHDLLHLPSFLLRLEPAGRARNVEPGVEPAFRCHRIDARLRGNRVSRTSARKGARISRLGTSAPRTTPFSLFEATRVRTA